jgi:hypothetical protein
MFYVFYSWLPFCLNLTCFLFIIFISYSEVFPAVTEVAILMSVSNNGERACAEMSHLLAGPLEVS